MPNRSDFIQFFPSLVKKEQIKIRRFYITFKYLAIISTADVVVGETID